MHLDELDAMPIQKLCTFCKAPAVSKYYGHNHGIVPACFEHSGTCHSFCWKHDCFAISIVPFSLLKKHPFSICPFTKQNPDIVNDPLIGEVVSCTAPAALAATDGELFKCWLVVKSRGLRAYIIHNLRGYSKYDICVRDIDIPETTQVKEGIYYGQN